MHVNDITITCLNSRPYRDKDEVRIMSSTSMLMRYSNLHFVKPIFSAAESVVLVIELALRKPRQLRSK